MCDAVYTRLKQFHYQMFFFFSLSVSPPSPPYNKCSAGYPANVHTYTYIHQFHVYLKLSSLLGCVEMTVNVYNLLDFHYTVIYLFQFHP